MASLAAIARQVNREGARWGLVAVIRDGAVKVSEMVAEIVPRAVGSLTVPVKVARVVCSLDETSALDAWSMVLAHRLRREHHDYMKLVNRRSDRLRAEGRRDIDQRRADFRRKAETIARNRVITTGIMR